MEEEELQQTLESEEVHDTSVANSNDLFGLSDQNKKLVPLDLS